jgi:endonuclease/exonuclease/phosphatase family metal-dependent hydrolase
MVTSRQRGQVTLMPRLRLACYNIAWFARLFDRRSRLVDDQRPSPVPEVTRHRQAEAVAEVLARVDADCYAIVEAPNEGSRQDCVAELEGFAARFGLRQRSALIGFESPTEQEIALLFDPDRIAARHAPFGELLDERKAATGALPFGTPRFDGVFPLRQEGGVALHRFLKPPLEARIEDRATGLAFLLIALHLQSRAALGDGGPDELRRRADANRHRQHAEAVWLRARIEEHLAAGEELVVLGDFNDGPGYDAEPGPSIIGLVGGDSGRPEHRLRNAFDPAGLPAGSRWPATARFYDDAGRPYLDALVDYILLAPGLAARTRPAWRIWHPFDDRECWDDEGLHRALLDASDHFPVSVDLEAGVSGANG